MSGNLPNSDILFGINNQDNEPNMYEFNNLPAYSQEEVKALIDLISLHIDNDTVQKFAESGLFLKMTHALQCSIKTKDDKAVERLCHLFNKLIDKDRNNFLILLNGKIDIEPYAGQSYFFTWMDQLYSAVFTQDIVSIINLNFVFARLLNSEDNLSTNMLLEKMEKGKYEGMNVLLLLMQTLTQATSVPEYHKEGTLIIAELLMKAVNSIPSSEINPILAQPIAQTTYSGQSMLTLFANIISGAIRHCPEIAKLISEKMLEIMPALTPQQIKDGFTTPIQSGPDEGMTTIHILLNSLVSANQVQANIDSIYSMLTSLSILVPSFNQILLGEIKTGNKTYPNGVCMVVQSLLAASENNLDVQREIAILVQLIKSQGSERVALALNQTLKYGPSTYLQLLTKFVQNHYDDPVVASLKDLIAHENDNANKSCASSAAALVNGNHHLFSEDNECVAKENKDDDSKMSGFRCSMH